MNVNELHFRLVAIAGEIFAEYEETKRVSTKAAGELAYLVLQLNNHLTSKGERPRAWGGTRQVQVEDLSDTLMGRLMAGQPRVKPNPAYGGDEEDFEFFGFKTQAQKQDNGAWNGYIEIPKGHPWFEKDYMHVDADVHGGLTFSGPRGGEGFWLGFDCQHYGDQIPSRPEMGGTFRDLKFVKNELKKLARQAFDADNYTQNPKRRKRNVSK